MFPVFFFQNIKKSSSFHCNSLLQVQRRFMETKRIPGVVGAIDCTRIPIHSPGGRNAENFRSRKEFLYKHSSYLWASTLFHYIVARWPGSTHDGNFCAKFERQEINGILLGDNGHLLRQYLITTLLWCKTRAFQHSHIRGEIENSDS